MTRNTSEMGVIPDGRLDVLLRQLPRRVRRTFLAALTGAETPRRARLERRARRMIAQLGIVFLVLMALAACNTPEDGYVTSQQAAQSYYTWFYTTGPNGEHCLMAEGHFRLAMDCDQVNWPSPSPKS